MKPLLSAVCLALALATPAYALDLLVNGDFELPLENGWTTTGGSTVTVTRGPLYDPDPDFEAQVAQVTSSGEGTLAQTVDLPGLDTGFSVRMTCAVSSSPTAWAAAGIGVVYQTASGTPLGETRIVACTRDCPWTSGPNLHLISAAENYWLEYSFNIAAEMSYLPGIDPSLIRRVSVRLLTSMYSC